MSGFDDDMLNSGDTRLSFIYEGVVVQRNDPEKLGRIRFAIPGLIEPIGPWAYPASTLGGGSKDRGFFSVPQVGAEVYVFFVGGDPTQPRYFSGHWGQTAEGNEVPMEAQQDPPDVTVLATKTFRIEINESDGDRRMRLSCKKNNDHIEFNAEENSITIQATTGLSIHALGVIDIRAATVQLNGRPVMTTTKAI